MPNAHGLNTKAIAEQLKNNLDLDKAKYPGIEVFYDHGDSS